MTFQQDNASIHSRTVKDDWFVNNGFDVMEWPARSPDLNPIENCWGPLARLVYADGRQFQNTRQLSEAVVDSWNRLPQEQLDNLIVTMPYRIFELIEAHGDATTY